MEIFGSILTVLLIGFILATLLTFSFALLIWFLAVGLVLAGGMYIQEWWRRWYFLRHAAPPENDAKVTDAEFVEITYKDK